MAFERFTETGSRFGDPQVSIWSRGQIGFNQGAVQEFDLAKYQYIVLFYDKETSRVGFKLTNDKSEKGAVKLIVRDKAGASISAIPFLKINKIDYKEKTNKYAISSDDESGLLVIDVRYPL